MRRCASHSMALLVGLSAVVNLSAAQQRDLGRPDGGGPPNAAHAPEPRRAPMAARPHEALRAPDAPRATPAPVARAAFDGHGQILDDRYDHGRYYPRFGVVRPALPPDYRPYYHERDRYYFNGGVWYAPRGPGFVVVRPPAGLVISVLPAYYSTVWIGGSPYYYADNVYYTWQPAQNGYAVVDPPANADVPSPPPEDAPQDLIVYPKSGQSKEQQAADQYECHRWAKAQTGFDPTQAGGGVAAAEIDRSRSNYNRAMSACLQGRGYQVN